MNLSEKLQEACKFLENHGFNDLDVTYARIDDQKQKLEDAKTDGLSEEETRMWMEEYCNVQFELDTLDYMYDPAPYMNFELDEAQLQADLKEFFAEYVPKDCIPDYIHYDGMDNEFMTPRYKNE